MNKPKIFENYNHVFNFISKQWANLGPFSQNKGNPTPYTRDWYIHLNIIRILTLGMIIYTDYPSFIKFKESRPSKAIIENFDPQSDSRWEDFSTLFTKHQKTATYYINLTFPLQFQAFCFPNANIIIPKIFLLEPQEEKYQNAQFSIELLKDFFQYLWQDIDFNLHSEKNPLNPPNPDLIQFHPIVLSNVYQQINLKNQKKLQKGIYYSPQAEIQLLIILNLTFLLEVRFHLNYSQKLDLFKDFKGLISKDNINEEDLTVLTILNTTLGQKLVSATLSLKILDPACGTGLFLREWFNLYLKLLKIQQFTPKQNFKVESSSKTLIFGMDINPIAISITDIIFYSIIFTKYLNKLDKIDSNLRSISSFSQGDFLLNKNPQFSNFDLILGNPPYIRNRDITHPYLNSSKLNILYRKQIRNSLSSKSLSIQSFSPRIDYALYFFIHSLEKLKNGGILGFISSNSWMNVKYGYEFQEFLITKFQIRMIIESSSRSFSDAQINTVLTCIQKSNIIPPLKNIVSFVNLKQDFESFMKMNNFDRIRDEQLLINQLELIKSNDIDSVPHIPSLNFHETKLIRNISISQQALYNFSSHGKGSNSLYSGFNWNNYFFHAPNWFLTLWNYRRENVLLLQDLATIRRGITTNCNHYFILRKIKENIFENGYGDRFNLPISCLVPILESPRNLETPKFHKNLISSYLFSYNTPKDILIQNRNMKENQKILDYITYGEYKPIKIIRGAERGKIVKGVINLPSFKQRYSKNPNLWYNIAERKPNKINHKKIIIQKIFDTQYKVGIIDFPLAILNTFYEITLKNQLDLSEDLVFSLLNGCLTMLSLEMQGRLNFGGGALDTASFDIGNILIPNPSLFNPIELQEILRIGKIIRKRKFKSAASLFKDSNQQKLDAIIFNALNIEVSLSQIYQDILQIQNFRVTKSNSI